MTTAVRQDSSRTIYIVLPLVFFFSFLLFVLINDGAYRILYNIGYNTLLYVAAPAGWKSSAATHSHLEIFCE